MNGEISQWEGETHKVLMAWWPRWQLVKEKDSRLISQCVKLLHRCLYTVLSHLFSSLFLSSIHFLSVLLSSLARSPPFLSSVSLTPQPLCSCITSVSSLSTSLYPIPHDLPLQPNALFSLNTLFLLTSCLHPSQWPCHSRQNYYSWMEHRLSGAVLCSLCISHLSSIPFCGEPSFYSPVMIGVLATPCICTVI